MSAARPHRGRPRPTTPVPRARRQPPWPLWRWGRPLAAGLALVLVATLIPGARADDSGTPAESAITETDMLAATEQAEQLAKTYDAQASPPVGEEHEEAPVVAQGQPGDPPEQAASDQDQPDPLGQEESPGPTRAASDPPSGPPSVKPVPPFNIRAVIEPPDDDDLYDEDDRDPAERFFDELRQRSAEDQAREIEDDLDKFARDISNYREHPDSAQARLFDPELIEGELADYLQFIDATFIHRELQPQAAEGVLSPEQEARLRARVEDLQRQLQEVLAEEQEEHGEAPEAEEGDAAEAGDFDYRSASAEEQVDFIATQLGLMVLRITFLRDDRWDLWSGPVPPLTLAGEVQARLDEYLQFIDGALRLQVAEGELSSEVVDQLRARAEDVRRELAEVLAEQPANQVNPDQIMRLTAGLTASFLQDARADYAAAAEAGDRAKLEAGLQKLEDWEETVPLSPEEQGRIESLQDRIRQVLDELPPAAGGEPTEGGMRMSMLDPGEVARMSRLPGHPPVDPKELNPTLPGQPIPDPGEVNPSSEGHVPPKVDTGTPHVFPAETPVDWRDLTYHQDGEAPTAATGHGSTGGAGGGVEIARPLGLAGLALAVFWSVLSRRGGPTPPTPALQSVLPWLVPTGPGATAG